MFKAFSRLFSGNILGKIIGVIREILIAGVFGTSDKIGAFRIAQTAVLMPANFMSSETLSAGFLPLYKKFKSSEKTKANNLFWSLFILSGVITVVISILLVVFPQIWINILAPGFGKEAAQLAAKFLKILAFSMFFYFVGILLSYLEMGNNEYYLASIRPSLQSLGLISGALGFLFFSNVFLLAWGFFAAYMLYFLIGIVYTINKKMLFLPTRFNFPIFKSTIKLFWDVAKYLLVLPFLVQGGIMVERIVASLISVDAVAALDYAKYITQTCLTMSVVPLGLAGLSDFSDKSQEQIREKLANILPLLLMFGIPFSLYIGYYSEEIVTVIFKRGAFDNSSVSVTKDILLGFSFGFWAEIIGYMLIRTQNAQLKNFEALKIMGGAHIVRIAANVVLYQYLGALALGIASSLYGFILMIWTVRENKVSNLLISNIYYMFFAVVVFWGLSFWWDTPSSLIGFIGVSLVFVIYWVIFYMVVPKFRNKLSFVLQKIRLNIE